MLFSHVAHVISLWYNNASWEERPVRKGRSLREVRQGCRKMRGHRQNGLLRQAWCNLKWYLHALRPRSQTVCAMCTGQEVLMRDKRMPLRGTRDRCPGPGTCGWMSTFSSLSTPLPTDVSTMTGLPPTVSPCVHFLLLTYSVHAACALHLIFATSALPKTRNQFIDSARTLLYVYSSLSWSASQTRWVYCCGIRRRQTEDAATVAV